MKNLVEASDAIDRYAKQQLEGADVRFTLILWDAEGYCVRGNGKPQDALPAIKAVVKDIEGGEAKIVAPKLAS